MIVPESRTALSVSLRWVFSLIFSIVYAGLLASLPLDVFKDRHNYLEYASNSLAILARFAAGGGIPLLANEPLWLAINIGLGQFFQPEQVLRTLIFVPAFLVSFLLVRHNPRHILWLMIFLLLPQVIKNHIIHLRQGAGLSVFLLGYYAGPRWLRVLLMTAAGFIHSSFLFLALIILMVRSTRLVRFSPGLGMISISMGFMALGFLLATIASSLGARQGEQYLESGSDVSGLGFLIWSGVLLLFISAGRDFIRQQMIPLAILSFYLAVYFLTPVSGRIFESGLILVLIAGLSLPGERRPLFLMVVLFYGLLQYGLRLDQPWLGWGADLMVA